MLRRLRTPRWLAFTVLLFGTAVACVVLGWWQWQRFTSYGGDGQNFGYTLQWPAFGLFAVYLWWRLLRDAEADNGSDSLVEEHVEPAEDETARQAEPVVERRQLEVDPDEDPELAAYNRYLAALNERTKA